MKKNISFLIVIFFCLIVFNIRVNAVESNSIMGMTCDNLHDPGTFLSEFVVPTKMTLYKLTDSSGNASFKVDAVVTGIDPSKASISSWKIKDEEINITSKLDSGICPVSAVIMPFSIEFYGSGSTAKNVIKLEKSRYIAYSFTDNNNSYKIIEGYSSKGKYAYAGVDLQNITNAGILELLFTDEVTNHQLDLIKNVGSDKYFKVDEYFQSTIIAGNGEGAFANVCKGLSKTECTSKHSYKVLISSGTEGRIQLKNNINAWLNDENNEMLKGYNKISKLSSDSKFINTCEEIKKANESNEDYDFSKINMNDFINKLSEGNEALTEAYDVSFKDCGTNKDTSITSSVVSCLVYSDILNIREIADLAAKDKDFMTNQGFLVEGIYEDVKATLKEILQEKGSDFNIVDASSDLNKYTELFYTASLYIKSREKQKKIELTDEQQKKLKDIIEKYKVIGDKIGIYPVVDCETLLGEDLIEKIRSYTNIVKIAIPIILIAYGVFEFTKAILTGEDEMQKAKKNFIKRIAIALLIFITPTIINLILQLANKVWTVISPDSCGIF